MVKNAPANAEDSGSIPESGRSPREGNGDPLQYSCLENFTGQRSLAGYSPRGHKESDMTEHSRAKDVRILNPRTCEFYLTWQKGFAINPF